VKFAFAIFLLIASIHLGHSQSSIEVGELFVKVESIIDNLPAPDGNDYVEPTTTQLDAWTNMLEKVWLLDVTNATIEAGQLDYDLIEFTDSVDMQVYYILQSKEINGNYWGTYVMNPSSCQTNLVIQSPHPKKDLNTGKQGIYVFEEVGASFFMLAGTNRCNSSEFSSCSGTTGVCNVSSQAYRKTDMAHVTESVFQKTHEFLYDLLPDPFVIQLHGFSWNSSSGLPNLIMSNTVSSYPSGFDYLNLLGEVVTNVDANLSYGVKHIDNTLPLSGSTNTQGRYCNNSPNPCSSGGVFNSGRFFHLEQSYSGLRQTQSDWNKMAVAITAVFQNMEIDSTALSSGRYQTQDSLLVRSYISSNKNIQLKAGKSIELSPNFSSEYGAVISIEVDSCSQN